jgi:hypothetical protein
MTKKQLIVAGIFFLFCSLLITNSYAGIQYYGENHGGFFCGICDGLKSLVKITLNLFYDNMGIYNMNNNGFFYNFGFFLSAMLVFAIPLIIIIWMISMAFFLGILFSDFVPHRKQK